MYLLAQLDSFYTHYQAWDRYALHSLLLEPQYMALSCCLLSPAFITFTLLMPMSRSSCFNPLVPEFKISRRTPLMPEIKSWHPGENQYCYALRFIYSFLTAEMTAVKIFSCMSVIHEDSW